MRQNIEIFKYIEIMSDPHGLVALKIVLFSSKLALTQFRIYIHHITGKIA